MENQVQNVSQMTVQKFQIEKDAEIQQAQYVIVNKWYKVTIVLVCLIALCVVAFIDKLQGVSPIIGVIIGLVLRSNSISDFLGTSKNTETPTES